MRFCKQFCIRTYGLPEISIALFLKVLITVPSFRLSSGLENEVRYRGKIESSRSLYNVTFIHVIGRFPLQATVGKGQCENNKIPSIYLQCKNHLSIFTVCAKGHPHYQPTHQSRQGESPQRLKTPDTMMSTQPLAVELTLGSDSSPYKLNSTNAFRLQTYILNILPCCTKRSFYNLLNTNK